MSKSGYENSFERICCFQKNLNNKISHTLKKISVGATETAILNSCFSNREVMFKNIAIEPEVIDLIKFLNESGLTLDLFLKGLLL